MVVNRAMAFADNLKEITDRGHHYLVASRQAERTPHLGAFEDETGWAEVIRQPSPRNPGQKKSRVEIKRQVVDGEAHLLCRGEGRTANYPRVAFSQRLMLGGVALARPAHGT